MVITSLIFIFIGVFLSIFSYCIVPINRNNCKKKKEKQKYCILVAARNESRVIESLLVSIENQTMKIDSKDVYIIVEEKDDPTILIAEKHNMNIVFRKDLSKRRKGYALDDAVKEILAEKKKYTAYFIIDADNVLDKNFIKELSKDIEKGYDIGIGYRNTKNGDNLVACASALAFSLLNTLDNTRKNKYSNTLSVSGTGFYIKGEIIEKLGGFPFNALTEDYELSLYSALNNLTMSYNDNACFYDEQPEDFKTSMMQRTRWVKGYFEARNIYINKIIKSINIKDVNLSSKLNAIIGINPLVFIFIGIVLFLINVIFNYSFIAFIISLLSIILIIYGVLAFITFIILVKERNKLNIKVSKIKLMLYNPIFLASFVICYFKAILKKNMEWQVIPHDKELKL